MLVPTDMAEYQAYQNTRQRLALSADDLQPLAWQNSQYAPHAMPNVMNGVIDLFNSNQLSIVSNIGPMTEPLTKTQLSARPDKMPAQLFSHNSQQALWQAAGNNIQQAQGWLGRIADILQDNATTLPMNIALGSSDILNSGNSSRPLVLHSSGPEEFALLGANQSSEARRFAAHQALLELAKDPLEREYRNRILATRENNVLLKAALTSLSPREKNYPTGNTLAEQLSLIADIIAVQATLNQARQVFFVGLGGWDTHDNQADQHPALLTTLSDALVAFQRDLQTINMADQVTTLTLSEFGRTLTTNKDGTDHGWAGHQFIMGGAIKGGQITGHLPNQTLGTQDDLGAGRIIPSTSIEQLGAALSRWFGLTERDIIDIFPNISRFDPNALDLFR